MKKREAKVLQLLNLTDRFRTGKVATGGLTMQINNGADGDLVWRFYANGRRCNEFIGDGKNDA
jgi:hypothetical protein